jgi:hypothetical protein
VVFAFLFLFEAFSPAGNRTEYLGNILPYLLMAVADILSVYIYRWAMKKAAGTAMASMYMYVQGSMY